MSDEELPVEGPEPEAAPVVEEPPVDQAAQERERLGKEAQKRIARLTYEREEARREVARLKAAPNPAAPASFDDQVRMSAEQMLAQKQFNDECDATFDKGKAEFPDFLETVYALNDIGMSDNPHFLDAVNDLTNGPAVLRHLAADPEEAAKLLRMKPGKMAVKLASISGELAKPVVKSLSKAPAPPEPIGGKATPTSRNPEDMPMAEYAVWFREQQKNYRR